MDGWVEEEYQPRYDQNEGETNSLSQLTPTDKRSIIPVLTRLGYHVLDHGELDWNTDCPFAVVWDDELWNDPEMYNNQETLRRYGFTRHEARTA